MHTRLLFGTLLVALTGCSSLSNTQDLKDGEASGGRQVLEEVFHGRYSAGNASPASLWNTSSVAHHFAPPLSVSYASYQKSQQRFWSRYGKFSDSIDGDYIYSVYLYQLDPMTGCKRPPYRISYTRESVEELRQIYKVSLSFVGNDGNPVRVKLIAHLNKEASEWKLADVEFEPNLITWPGQDDNLKIATSSALFSFMASQADSSVRWSERHPSKLRENVIISNEYLRAPD